MKHLIPLAILGLFLGSCASAPKLSDSWRDPNVHDFTTAKTAVVVMSAEGNFRRVAEDELVRQFGKSPSAASYDFLTTADLQDPKKCGELARAHGFDSALVMRVLEVNEVQQRVPGAYSPVYMTFSGSGTAYLWPSPYDDGYTYTEKTYRVETSLYALGDDKLVWSGVVVIRDPDSTRELAAFNAGAVLPELRAQKLVR